MGAASAGARVKLYNAETGVPEDVPDADVPAALQSQKYGLPAGATIPVQGEDGSIKTVPIEQSHTVDWTKASVVPHSALEAQELQATHGGVGQQIKAGVEGLASGATLGASDALEGAVLGNTGDIEQRRKANPWTSGVTQAVGALAPSLLAPETGAGETEEVGALGRLGQIGAAPSRGVGWAGGAVEGGIRDMLGASQGDSFVAALAKNAAAKGAGAATEGAIYGATQHLDEQMLGDPDANGESLLAATGHGALLGLGLGSGLGAAGEIGSAALGKVAPHLSGLAARSAAEAVSPKAEKALADLPGGIRAAGRRLLDDGLVSAGDTSEQIAAKMGPAADEAEARAARVLSTADAAGAPGPSLRTIVDDSEKEISALKARPDSEEAANALRKQLDHVESAAGIPKEASPLDPSLFPGVDLPPSIDRKAVLDAARLPFARAAELTTQLEGPIKGIVQRELDAAGASAAKKMGGAFLEDYNDAKLAAAQYRALAAAPPHAPGKGVSWGAAGLGLLTHGPLGAASGAALGLAKQWAAERGRSTAAVVLDKLSALRGIEQASQRVDRQIARGLSGITHGAPTAAVKVSKAGGTFEQRAAAVQRAAADPGAAADAATAGIQEHAPKVAASFKSAAVRATNYLAAQIPKSPLRVDLTPQLDKPSPISKSEQRAFMRKFDAVHDPASVLQSAHEGRVTPDQVQALAQTKPALYAKIQAAAHARLADRKTPLSSSQRTSLSILTGQPTHSPDVARAFQATFAPAEPPKQNQDTQHRNKDRAGGAPRRPITSPARNIALDVGRPVGS
jgi:hypothetical protein